MNARLLGLSGRALRSTRHVRDNGLTLISPIQTWNSCANNSQNSAAFKFDNVHFSG